MLRKALVGLLLALPAIAQAASVTYISSATNPNTSASATYTTASFTPTAGRVQFGACIVSGTLIDPPTITNSLGGTYTVIDAIVQSTNNQLYAFVADQTSTASAQTVTVDVTGDNGTGGFCEIFEADFTRTGSGALKQAIAILADQAGPSTPAVIFGSAVTTSNITFGCVMRIGSNPATVTEPSGWTEGVDTGYDTPTIGLECAYRNSGFTGTTITWGSSESAYAAFGIELDVSAVSTPAEFVSVTVNAVADGHDVDYEVTNENAQVYGVKCSPGDANSNQTELEAGQCGGGNAAWFAANEAATADIPADLALTEANNPVRGTVTVGCAGATGDCTLDINTNQDRSLRSGYLMVVMASHDAAGICGENAYFDEDCADGDIFEYKAVTEESADCAVAISAIGFLTLTPTTPGDCGGPGIRRTIKYSAQNVSSLTDGLFTAPAAANFTTDDTIYVNNVAPELVAENEFQFLKGTAIEAVNFEDRWSDVEGDALTVTLTAIPTSLSYANNELTGTPSVCETVPATEEATDVAGDSTQNTALVFEVWSLIPDVVTGGVNEATAIASIEAECPDWTAVAGTPRYSSTVALGNVIETNPVSGWFSPPDQIVTYVLSLGPAPSNSCDSGIVQDPECSVEIPIVTPPSQ